MGDHWIDKRLAELPQKNKSGLAKALGIPTSRMSEITGGVRKIKITEIESIAEYLELPLGTVFQFVSGNNLLGNIDDLYQPIMVRGEVAASVWGTAIEWPHHRWVPVSVPSNEEFKDSPQFGLNVVGDSMDLIFPDGTLLVCVSYLDLDKQPANGQYVIIHRTNKDGLIEATCKKYVVDDAGGVWLMPESSKPEFSQPIKVDQTAESDNIVIVARVISSTRFHTGTCSAQN